MSTTAIGLAAVPDVSPGPGRARTVLIVSALAVATFVTALDNTVVNVALPTLQRELRLTSTGLEWVVAAYLVTFASFMFLGGRLADHWGRRRTLVTGLVLFAVASALAASADDSAVLVTARALGGAGAAFVIPAALAVLAADVPVRAQRIGIGIATGLAALALTLGPLIGGAITENWGWNGIFLINLPAVAVCLALLFGGGPARDDAVTEAAESRDGGLDDPPAGRPGLGLAGIASAGVIMCAAVWLLVEVQHLDWAAPATIVVLAVGGIAVGCFAALAARGRAAIVDGALLRNRVFGATLVATVLSGVALTGVFFFTSLYLQTVDGLAPAATGLIFLPLSTALLVAVAASGRLVTLLGERIVVAGGFLLIAAGLTWVGLQVGRAGAPGAEAFLLPLVVVGFGAGLTVPLTSMCLESVDRTRAGMASSLVTAGREFAGALGVACVGLVLALRSGALRASGSDPRAAFVGGYEWGLLAAAALMMLAAVLLGVALPTASTVHDARADGDVNEEAARESGLPGARLTG